MRAGLFWRFGSEGGVIVGQVVRIAAQGLSVSQRCSKSSSRKEHRALETELTRMCALLVGLPARRHRDRCRRLAVMVAGRSHHRPRAAVVLQPNGVASPHPRGRAGGPAGVRPPGAPRVVQATLELPDVRADMDRPAPGDYVGPVCAHDSRGTLGDGAGRSPWLLRCRGC